MGRLSLAESRRIEILDAFERSVARYGLQSSSLECVAQEAGMKRSILRHDIGNRDVLVHALAERMAARLRAELDDCLAPSVGGNATDRLLGYLFPSVLASALLDSCLWYGLDLLQSGITRTAAAASALPKARPLMRSVTR